jgi:hypothetical protein
MKKSYFPVVLAVAGLFLGAADKASAFPRTKEEAKLTINFDLTAPVGTAEPAPTGTATIDVTRIDGVEDASQLEITTSNLADGTYDVEAILKSDETDPPTPVLIGQITVAGATAIAPLDLPAAVKALDIETLNIVDPADPTIPTSTDVVVLSGTPTEDIEKWTYFANRPVTAADSFAPTPGTNKHGKPTKVKPIHGHVLIQAKIVDNNETRRKFLLVAHNGPADTELTIRLDGVDAGTFTTTKNGKMMVKSLEGDFRLAGVHLMEIVDATTETVVAVAEADFFPDVE